MKYLKLFENFSNESEHPFSITVVPTEKFKRKLQDMKNSDGEPTFLTGNEFRLVRYKQNQFNLVKVATTPIDSSKNDVNGKSVIGKQDDYWLSYDPKNSEIYVHTSRIFGTSYLLNDFAKKIELLSTDRRYSTEDYRDEGLIWIGGYYCKFEKGFEVGMVSDGEGYFKITAVEPF